MSTLLEYGIDIGEISENAAKGVRSVKYEKVKTKPWPKEKIEAVRSILPHSDKTRLLFELLYCTGQRVGDVLKAEWSDIRGDAIDVSQGKTGAELLLPLSDDLRECLRRAGRGYKTILCRDASKHKYKEPGPWSYRSASYAMLKIRKHRDVQAEDYGIHAIRHTVASEIAQGGGTDDETMAVTGHTTKGMVAHYAGPARQISRAVKAQKRRK